MSAGSAIPDAITGLVTLFAQAGVQGVTVNDGPDYDSRGNYLAVGWDRSDDAAVQATREHQDRAGSRKFETFTVSCLLTIHKNKASVAQVRALAYSALAVYDQALTADRRLGSTQIVGAEITEHDYTPYRTEVGTACDLRFTVEVQAVK